MLHHGHHYLKGICTGHLVDCLSALEQLESSQC
uniref:Uncharacterized protein n=1 Tax=Anguilla anguilla TaxID=7936 RepID=A0A0E9WA16_ANGAN